jgi:hypothetical protein
VSDENIGTQERKRAAKAMPLREERQSLGCLVTSAVYVAICGFLVWLTAWPLVWLVFAVPGVIALTFGGATQLRGALLLRECRRALEPRGVRFLVVYSESPAWENRIRDSWLPRFGKQAVLLNWTERARWPRSLEVRLFKYFIASQQNFNPAVLVLRGTQRPLVYRFFYAFQQAKHGRLENLAQLEAELFAHVQSATPTPQSPTLNS